MLTNGGQFDEDCLNKILRTLTAMANQGKESVGYVIIGIADDKDDAKKFDSFYKKKTLSYKDFFIAGVQEEAMRYYKTPELYRNNLESKIRNTVYIEQKYKEQILRNVDFVKYNDRTIVILKIVNEGEAVKFDGKYYERQGTRTVEVENEAQMWKRFF